METITVAPTKGKNSDEEEGMPPVNDEDIMTVDECTRLHRAMMGELNAKFDASKQDREALHKTTEGLIEDLKYWMRWFLGIGGAIILILLSITGILLQGGGFAKHTDIASLKERQAVYEAIRDADSKIVGKLCEAVDKIESVRGNGRSKTE